MTELMAGRRVLVTGGGTGSGGPKSASTAIPITISAVNDLPLVIVNSGAFVAEGGVGGFPEAPGHGDLDPVLDQLVYPKVFSHIAEEVFLTPSGE